MSKYLNEKAKSEAIKTLTFMRIHNLKFGLIKTETEEELKDVRSLFHSVGKVKFNKNHYEVIEYLNENLKEIVEIANKVSEEALQFELEEYKKAVEEQRYEKYKKHPDFTIACDMYHEVFNLMMEDKLKVKEDEDIIIALQGKVRNHDYGTRILVKRLYARNINEKTYFDGKKNIPLEYVFKIKDLQL